MQIDRNSWHWKVIRMFNDPWIEDRVTDSCAYIKTLAWTCFKLLILYAVILSLAISGLVGLYEFGGAIFGYIDHPDPNLAALGGTLIALPVIVYAVYLYSNWSLENQYKTKPKGFLSQAIDRAKNKYCSKIEFLD